MPAASRPRVDPTQVVHLQAGSKVTALPPSPITPITPTLRLQMMRLGCSSTGRERMRAATSSAVFHLASCDRRFCPAHTLQGSVGVGQAGAGARGREVARAQGAG
jgi:hypothetical protein